MDLDRILKKPLAGEFLTEEEAAALLSLPPDGRAPVYAAAARMTPRARFSWRRPP